MPNKISKILASILITFLFVGGILSSFTYAGDRKAQKKAYHWQWRNFKQLKQDASEFLVYRPLVEVHKRNAENRYLWQLRKFKQIKEDQAKNIIYRKKQSMDKKNQGERYFWQFRNHKQILEDYPSAVKLEVPYKVTK